ncbi:hypothetical protein Xen7305DRAFT_00051870 [Xenococcus sp. PCC 7305]|uniref:hypothetical protein n=1 Tax=Xenococcus sp. PCC 7305 TaxID=102125 RepID=UPI0002ACE03B|nr:hypothetical protein [Xenococcus sp. PCC 7305]ELS05443.1 hypothetical protein Xen7305DRAFT_00051870 [Xenococcus sp. PCC 7305]
MSAYSSSQRLRNAGVQVRTGTHWGKTLIASSLTLLITQPALSFPFTNFREAKILSISDYSVNLSMEGTTSESSHSLGSTKFHSCGLSVEDKIQFRTIEDLPMYQEYRKTLSEHGSWWQKILENMVPNEKQIVRVKGCFNETDEANESIKEAINRLEE